MLSNGYILILIWVGVIAALAVMAPAMVYRTELVNGEKVRRVTPLFAVVAVLPLMICAGFRGNVGNTGTYMMGDKISSRHRTERNGGFLKNTGRPGTNGESLTQKMKREFDKAQVV